MVEHEQGSGVARLPFPPGLRDRVSTVAGVTVTGKFLLKIRARGDDDKLEVAVVFRGSRLHTFEAVAAKEFMEWFYPAVQDWLASNDRIKVKEWRPYATRIEYKPGQYYLYCRDAVVEYLTEGGNAARIPALEALINADLAAADPSPFPFPFVGIIHLI